MPLTREQFAGFSYFTARLRNFGLKASYRSGKQSE